MVPAMGAQEHVPTSRSTVAVVVAMLLGLAVLAMMGQAVHDTGHGDAAARIAPPLWPIGVAPFVILLLAIAVLPLISWTAAWWHSNLHRLLLSAGLGVITCAFMIATQGT